MLLSILVVSRTPELLNRLLQSLDAGFNGIPEEVEILCSWNGSRDAEALIKPGRLPFAVVQRDPYHFASNMNRLANQATGRILSLVNDDLIVDPGAINAAIERLEQQPEVGLVGARLRKSDGSLAHGGMHFRPSGEPYHQLEWHLPANHPWALQERPVPCVTGAFMAMRREDFKELQLAESFLTCGEDVLLCLQVRSLLHKSILYCPEMSGIHDEKSTRGHLQEDRPEDMLRMQAGWKETCQHLDRQQLLEDLQSLQRELELLQDLHAEALNKAAMAGAIETKLEEATRKLRQEQAAQLNLRATQARNELESSLRNREMKQLLSKVSQLEQELELKRKPWAPGRARGAAGT